MLYLSVYLIYNFKNFGGVVNIGCEKCFCLNGNFICDLFVCLDFGLCLIENKIKLLFGLCCFLCFGKCMFFI